jgi:hypothetical protein
MKTTLSLFSFFLLIMLACILISCTGCTKAERATDSISQEYSEAARRMETNSHLKLIGLAFSGYADVHNKTFPPAFNVDNNGKPLLSWRVLILPMLDGGALYDKFHLDEPWDSEHNKNLIAKMPEEYKSPNSKVASEGKTNYLTVRGERTVFPGKKGIKFAEIVDGMENTILMVEVPDNKAVIWTKPDDFEYDDEHPLKGLIGMWPNGFYVVLANGTIKFLLSSIDPKLLKALFTRNGDESTDWSDIVN